MQSWAFNGAKMPSFDHKKTTENILPQNEMQYLNINLIK
jgi:hypothetical protein